MKTYTGVGARQTPDDVLRMMQAIAVELDNRRFTLRSGGAHGADSAFESGNGYKEIYYARDANVQAREIAARFHPAWHTLSMHVRNLHGRNAFQVLGLDLRSPSSFLICWTPDGVTTHAQRSQRTGGTGTAISIADYYNVPVFNLERKDHRARLQAMLDEGDKR